MKRGFVPVVSGGCPNRLFLCREWLTESAPVLLCQPVGPNPVIRSISIHVVRNLIE